MAATATLPKVDLKAKFQAAYSLRERNKPVPACFDPAADLILMPAAHPAKTFTPDEIKDYFDDYFTYGTGKPLNSPVGATPCKTVASTWPIPETCVQLQGTRGSSKVPNLKQLFVGDVVWLYYLEEMGIFKILQVLLDDYETKGQHPFDRSKPYGLILEAMARERRAYLGSRPVDREALLNRTLGWKYAGQTKPETTLNSAFADHFDHLMQLLGKFYRDRDLAVQLRESMGGSGSAPLSSVSLTAIQDTIRLLRRSMRAFDYGRSHTTALVGIVWAIGGLALLRDTTEVIGVPQPYESPDQYLPAAYETLVEKGAASASQINRYLAHKHLADHARDILIDLEVIDELENAGAPDTLKAWLDEIDEKVLAYTAGYRALYDIDLAAGGKHKQRA